MSDSEKMPVMPWDSGDLKHDEWFYGEVTQHLSGTIRSEHRERQIIADLHRRLVQSGYGQRQPEIDALQDRVTELEGLLRDIQDQVGDGTLLRHCLTPKVRNKIDAALNARKREW